MYLINPSSTWQCLPSNHHLMSYLDFLSNSILSTHRKCVCFVHYLINYSTLATLASNSFLLQGIAVAVQRGHDLSASSASWRQACLSPSQGGLGLHPLFAYCSATYFGSVFATVTDFLNSHHTTNAMDIYNNLVPPDEGLLKM